MVQNDGALVFTPIRSFLTYMDVDSCLGKQLVHGTDELPGFQAVSTLGLFKYMDVDCRPVSEHKGTSFVAKIDGPSPAPQIGGTDASAPLASISGVQDDNVLVFAPGEQSTTYKCPGRNGPALRGHMDEHLTAAANGCERSIGSEIQNSECRSAYLRRCLTPVILGVVSGVDDDGALVLAPIEPFLTYVDVGSCLGRNGVPLEKDLSGIGVRALSTASLSTSTAVPRSISMGINRHHIGPCLARNGTLLDDEMDGRSTTTEDTRGGFKASTFPSESRLLGTGSPQCSCVSSRSFGIGHLCWRCAR